MVRIELPSKQKILRTKESYFNYYLSLVQRYKTLCLQQFVYIKLSPLKEIKHRKIVHIIFSKYTKKSILDKTYLNSHQRVRSGYSRAQIDNQPYFSDSLFKYMLQKIPFKTSIKLDYDCSEYFQEFLIKNKIKKEQCSKIEELDLHYYKYMAWGGKFQFQYDVINGLKKLKNLRSLKLSYSNVAENCDNMEKLFEYISKMHSLEKFSFCLEKGSFYSEELGQAISKLKNVKNLELSFKNIQLLDNSDQNFSKQFQNFQGNLKKLEWGLDSQMRIKELCQVLMYTKQNLEEINIDFFNVKSCVDNQLKLAQAIGEQTRLKRLTLQFNSSNLCQEFISNKEFGIQNLQGFEYLGLFLKDNMRSYSGINYIKSIVDSLGEFMPNLKSLDLDLSENEEGQQHWEDRNQNIKDVFQGLGKLRKLERLKLWLQDNELQNKGVEMLFQVLGNMDCLRYLNVYLQNNGVGDQGVNFMFERLQDMKNLEQFYLRIEEEDTLYDMNCQQDFEKIIGNKQRVCSRRETRNSSSNVGYGIWQCVQNMENLKNFGVVLRSRYYQNEEFQFIDKLNIEIQKKFKNSYIQYY